MTQTRTVDQSTGTLEVRTGVAGRSARLGHSLVLAPGAWRAVVEFDGDVPAALTVTVEAASLQVRSGQGGLTPLSPPERAVATANAHRSLDVKKFPTIEFRSATMEPTASGFAVAGTLTIRGVERPCGFALEYDGAELALAVPVTQTDFGIKPFSLMLGTLRVADEVVVSARALP